MLSNFFRINMPYGIRRNENDEWFCFNREYKPLGFNNTGSSVPWDQLPLYTRFKGMTDKFLLNLSEGCEKFITRDPSGKITMVHFYHDVSNPSDSKQYGKYLNSIVWEQYFRKIKMLADLKRYND